MRWPSNAKLLFIEFFIFYAAMSAYFAYGLNVYHNDAISRTALAFFTIFGRDPHLAAVGFVWQPLPSLAQIPLLLLLKPFHLMMLAGPLVTSFAGAVSVAALYKIGQLVQHKKSDLLPALVAILFGFNPMIILYSAIGTSEMVFIACLMVSSFYLIKWYLHSKQQHLLLAGLFVSLTFWSRYESLAVFAGCCALLAVKAYVDKFSIRKIEASYILFILPFLYSVSIWVLLNWFIMKDPFYFLNSPYSNASFTGIFRTNPSYLEGSYNSIVNSILYVSKRALILSPILIMILSLPLFFMPLLKRFVLGTISGVTQSVKNSSEKLGLSQNFSKFHVLDKIETPLFETKNSLREFGLFLFLVTPYAAILAFHAYQLYKGESFGWLRFYMYALVLGSLVALYFAIKYKILTVISLFLLVVGIATSAYAMGNHSLGREEESFVQITKNNSAVLDFSRTYQDQKKISKLMDSVPGKVLLDTDKGFAIPLFSKNPEKYIITSDIDYIKIVKNYPSYVDWIILPKPAPDDRGQNKIYTYYPKIWEGKAPRIKLYREIDSWRIYKVERKKANSNKAL